MLTIKLLALPTPQSLKKMKLNERARHEEMLSEKINFTIGRTTYIL